MQKTVLGYGLVFSLLLVTCISYFPVLKSGFQENWDDDFYLTQNPSLILPLKEALLTIWTTSELPSYYPLTFTSLYLLKQSFGLDPFPFHLFNLCLHLANILLFWMVLRFFPLSWWSRLFVVTLYALHPAQVESVAWITELKNVLSAFFFWLSWWAFLLFLQNKKKRFYGICFFSFLLALFSKGMALTLPVTFLLWKMQVPELSWKKMFVYLLPFFLLTFFFAGVTYWEEHQYVEQNAQTQMLERSFNQKIQEASQSFFFYPSTLVYPVKLSPIYPQRWFSLNSFGSFVCVFGVLLVLALLTFFFLQKRHLLFVFGVACYGVVASPILGFFTTSFHGISVMADRYFYHPMPFLMIALFACLDPYLKKHRVNFALWLLLLVGLGGLTWKQSQFWKGELSLWLHASSCYSHPQIEYHLGMTYKKNRQYQEAYKHLQKALQHEANLVVAWHALGQVCVLLQKNQEAESVFQKILKFDQEDGQAWNNLGVVYQNEQKWDQAISAFEKALKAEKASSIALIGLGKAHLSRKTSEDRKKAEGYFLEALKQNIQTSQAHNYLLQIHFFDYDKAIVHLENILQQNSQHPKTQRLFHVFFQHHPTQQKKYLELKGRYPNLNK